MTISALPTAALPAGDPIEPAWNLLFTDAAECARAAEVWGGVVSEMKTAGTLSPANGEAIRRYCVAAVLYDRAAVNVAERGPVIARSGRQLPAWNLWFSAMKDAAGMMETGESELGIAPRRRAAATAAKRKRAAGGQGAAAYLGAAGSGRDG